MPERSNRIDVCIEPPGEGDEFPTNGLSPPLRGHLPGPVGPVVPVPPDDADGWVRLLSKDGGGRHDGDIENEDDRNRVAVFNQCPDRLDHLVVP